jgi:hypothetical protein
MNPFDDSKFKAIMKEFEKSLEPYRDLMTRHAELLKQLQAPIQLLLDDPKIKELQAMHDGFQAMQDEARKQLESVTPSADLIQKLLDKENQEFAAEAMRAADANNRLMESIRRANAAAEERIADRVAQKLREPVDLPVQKKPAIGFGKPRDKKK